MASEPLFVGSSSRHFDLRLYDALWLIRSTNDHRPESFLFFIFCALLASQGPPWRSRQMTAPVKLDIIGPDIWLR